MVENKLKNKERLSKEIRDKSFSNFQIASYRVLH